MLAFAGLVVSGKACSDLTAPAGVNDVSIGFRLATGQTRLDLIVGDSVRPDVFVMLGGIEQSRARYVFTSSDPNVIRVYAGGDSIVAEDRGTATLVVTLVGTTIGNNRVNPASRTADTIVVASAALTNQVTPSTVAFQSISARQSLQAQSIGRNGRVIVGTNIVWRSDNTAVATVAPVDENTADVVAVGNGGTTVWAVFGGVDSTSIAVTVTQQMKRFLLTTAVAPTLRSINETMAVSARAVDSLGNTIDVAGGAPPPPAPTFVSENPGRVEIDGVSGLMTARGNTAETPVKITATVGGATRSDTLLVTVAQVAASLTIQGADTIRLLSIGDSRSNISVLAPDALGTQIPNTSIRWESSDPSRVVATGNALGTVTAENPGTVVVRARADQQVDSIIVIVTNDPAIVTLSPKPLELRSLDEIQTMTATVANSAGTPLPGATVTWISRDSSIVEPQATPGEMRARAVGQTRIVALASNGRADSTTVRVTNAPDTVNIIPTTLTLASVGDTDGTFAVDLKNARGVALPRDAANWSSHDVTIARALGGVITAVGAGTTWIVAVSPENSMRRDSVLVTVTNAASSVTVSPDPAPALTALGTTRTFTAVVRNASGNVITTPVTWSVPAGGAFVSIDPVSGVATAVANGTATIRATAGGVSSDVPLTVAQAIAPSRSTITAGVATLAANGTATTAVTVRLRDANDAAITTGGATVTLGLSPAIATLSAITDNGDGTYTATLTAGTTTGSVTITGTVNGQSITNTGSLTFTAGAVAQYVVTVTPTLQPVAGSSVTITARAADANGNSVAQPGSVVTWSSFGGGSFSAPTSTTNASGVATVTFTTSTTATQHTVSANDGTSSGTSPVITTVPGAAANYGVTVSSQSPVAGSQVVLSAQLRDANGNAVAVPGQSVAWTKSDPNGVFSSPTTVTNAAGVATVTLTTHTVAGTSTTVTATTGGVTGVSAAITTVAGASTQLTLTQAPSATAQSGVPFPTQPVLQLRDANGNAVAQANVSVTATITAGGGTLSGVPLVQTNAAGTATFTDLAITGANGGRTLTFSTSGVSSATAGVTLGAGSASQMALNDGNGQNAPAGSAVALAPSVIVRDAANNPVVGVNVTFAVTGGGGSIAPATGVASTDASGIARLTSWTLGTSAGTNTLTASVAGLTGSPVTFTATGTAGTATQMTTSVGAQSATVNTPVPTDPSVLVRDANNNPISNVPVTFTVTGGGGSISSPSGNTVLTNAAGIAALSSWTLGTTAGANTLDATSAGLPTVTFTATGTAGPATHIAVNGGNGQSVVVNNPVTPGPSVTVRDAHNNPVAGTGVTFTVTSGGGTTNPASGSSIPTDAAGVAALTSWTPGTTAGTNTLSATAAGLIGSPVTFTATGLVDVVSAAQTTVLRTGSNNVAADGSTTSEITVTLRDQHGNPIAGRTVALDDAGSTSVISAPSGTTSNAVGEVRFLVTNTTIETVTYTATANDPGPIVITQTAQVTFVATTPIIVASSGTVQTGVIGTPVAAPPTVFVRDAANNPLPGVNVTFTLTANGGGGTINPASPAVITTDAAGLASLTSWTLGPIAGTNNNAVTVTAPGVLGSPVTFTASGQNPVPDLTSISPVGGVQGETLDVVFTGTGFVTGATINYSSPGNGLTINSVTVNSSTQVTANITVLPGASLGSRNIRVVNPAPGGGNSPNRAFTVSAPAVPTLASLAPANGSRSQTLNVVFTGTGFASGVTSVNVPAGFTVNTVTVNSATQLTANITVGAAAAFGAHNFTVTNTPAGGTSAAQVFTVDFPAPTLTSIAPAAGNRLQTLDVVFTGTNFIAGVSSVNVGAGITVNTTTVDSPTQITANITIAATAATGNYSFTVTNTAPGGGTSAAQTFTVSNPAPTLTGIAPASGERLETLDVVFTGTGFITGVSMVNAGPNITVNSVTVNSSIQLTANITVDATASTGARNFSVANAAPGGGTSANQAFTVTNPAPTLSAVAPATGFEGENALDIVLTGTGFVPGSVVMFSSADININSTTVNSATQITVNVDIVGGATPGAFTVDVTNAAPGGGTSGTQTFNIAAPPVPTLTGLAPATGDRLQTLDVVFTGTNFARGVTTVDAPAGITVNSTTVNSRTQLTANITIDAATALGGNSFTVTNSGAGSSGAQTFIVNNPVPTITSVSPDDVPVGIPLTTTNVGSTNITGTGFISGVTTVTFVEGDVTIAGIVTVNSSTSITVTNIVYPGMLLTSQPRTIRVTNTAFVNHTITLHNP